MDKGVLTWSELYIMETSETEFSKREVQLSCLTEFVPTQKYNRSTLCDISVSPRVTALGGGWWLDARRGWGGG